MADAGFFRGTSADQDGRFTDKEKKLLKTMKFEEALDKKVDMSRVNLDVLKPWITHKLNEMLGMEDDVVVEYVIGQLEAKEVNPKIMQINITGFLNARHSREFMGELWTLMDEAQNAPDGIPPSMVEKKMSEMGMGDKKKEPEMKKEAENDWTKRYETVSRGRYSGLKGSPEAEERRRSPRRERDRSKDRTPPRRRQYDEDEKRKRERDDEESERRRKEREERHARERAAEKMKERETEKRREERRKEREREDRRKDRKERSKRDERMKRRSRSRSSSPVAKRRFEEKSKEKEKDKKKKSKKASSSDSESDSDEERKKGIRKKNSEKKHKEEKSHKKKEKSPSPSPSSSTSSSSSGSSSESE